jgi:hypothetical protein
MLSKDEFKSHDSELLLSVSVVIDSLIEVLALGRDDRGEYGNWFPERLAFELLLGRLFTPLRRSGAYLNKKLWELPR